MFGYEKYRGKSILRMFDKYDVKISRLYIKKSNVVNAYSVMFFFIVFTNEIKRVLKDVEIFSVLLHEKGHQTLSCIKWNALIFITIIFYSYIVFTLNINPIINIIIFRTVLVFLISIFIKKTEKNADLYAVKILGKNRKWLINSLMKITKKRTRGKFGKIYNYLFFYPFELHPELRKRIKYIKSYKTY